MSIASGRTADIKCIHRITAELVHESACRGKHYHAGKHARGEARRPTMADEVADDRSDREVGLDEMNAARVALRDAGQRLRRL